MRGANMDGSYYSTIFVNQQSFNVNVCSHKFFLDYSVVGDVDVFFDDFHFNIKEIVKYITSKLGEKALRNDNICIWEEDYDYHCLTKNTECYEYSKAN